MIYGNKFLPKKEESISMMEFGIESIAYNEYHNYKGLLESCTNEVDRPILEAQVKVLRESFIKDIFEKIKGVFERIKNFIKGIVDTFKNTINIIKTGIQMEEQMYHSVLQMMEEEQDFDYKVDFEKIRSEFESNFEEFENLRETNRIEEGQTILRNLAETNPTSYFILQDYIKFPVYTFSDIIPLLSDISHLNSKDPNYNDRVNGIIEKINGLQDQEDVLKLYESKFANKIKNIYSKQNKLDASDVNALIDSMIYNEAKNNPLRRPGDIEKRYALFKGYDKYIKEIVQGVQKIESNISKVQSSIDNIVTSLVNEDDSTARSVIKNIYTSLMGYAGNMRTYLKVCSIIMSKATHSIKTFNNVLNRVVNYVHNNSNKEEVVNKLTSSSGDKKSNSLSLWN